MKNYNRDLLIMLKATSISEEALEKQMKCLHKVLLQVENNDAFCNAHQLVTRIRITSKKKDILKAITPLQLKPFFFLVNKN
ncbi:MAG: hypothetical protein ABR502_02945 [Chitinophagaceae bacterium]